MKSLYLLIIIYIGLYLSGCTTTTTDHPTYSQSAKQTEIASNQTKIKSEEKNPLTVAMYTENQKPPNPYKVLGTETISKFNYNGIKRQIANIHDAMRMLAAKMGGDAVINIAHDDKTVTGTVISYQDKTEKTSV